MNRSLNLFFAVLAGMLGSLLIHYAGAVVHAQTSASNEIRAQSFAIVDENNNVVGTFKAERRPLVPAPRTVILVDADGREIWRGSGATVRPLGSR